MRTADSLNHLPWRIKFVRFSSTQNPALLRAYDYPLPAQRIAQHPLEQRDTARMMLLQRGRKAVRHSEFRALPELIPPRSVLVVNDTRVRPARLQGQLAGGAKIECLLLNPLDPRRWYALVRNGRRLKPGTRIPFAEGALCATALHKEANGCWLLDFQTEDVLAALEHHGLAPLPPYIHRRQSARQDASDRERYQTCFAQHSGSVAAPTAGLHFTPELLALLCEAGHICKAITLHVGWGTFAPLRNESLGGSLNAHRMHAESFQIPQETARTLHRAQACGQAIIAVGTTVVRALETWAAAGAPAEGINGVSELFIRPPFRFRVAQGLLTNLHQPRSTLLILVAAFHGRSRLLFAYEQALEQSYRFCSFGDCMLILPKT